MNYLYEKIKWPPALRALGERRGTTGNRIYYLAVPPAAFEEIVGWVGKHKSRKGWTRVIVEKPFGHDLQSAQDLNVLLHKQDRKSTRLNSSHGYTSYAVFCLKKKNITTDWAGALFAGPRGARAVARVGGCRRIPVRPFATPAIHGFVVIRATTALSLH